MSDQQTDNRLPYETWDDDLDETNSGSVSWEETRRIDEAAGLKLISIRLDVSLLADLKFIADHHGILYQPLVREVLQRFCAVEKQKVLRAKLKEHEKKLAQLRTKPRDSVIAAKKPAARRKRA